MVDGLEIRKSVLGDGAAIEALYGDAFPEEDLLPLVQALLTSGPIVLSMVGVINSICVGHIMFTRCGVTGSESEITLLGPLAIAPAHQREGVGSALVRLGLQHQQSAGLVRACVLGDPAYYGRFGFVPEDDITPPYPLPAAWQGAWQSLSLTASKQLLQGKLTTPPPWCREALWTD